MCFELRRYVDLERHPAADARFEYVEIRLDEVGFLTQRRRARAQLRQRGAQVIDQMPEQRARLLRIRLGQILHGCERVEEKVRLDLRLHQFELGFDRLLRQQMSIGFRLVERRRGACLTKFDEKDETDEQAVDECSEEVPDEPMVASYVIDRIALDLDDQHETDERADAACQRETDDRRALVPRRGDVDAVGDRVAVQLNRDERMPERPGIVDP